MTDTLILSVGLLKSSQWISIKFWKGNILVLERVSQILGLIWVQNPGHINIQGFFHGRLLVLLHCNDIQYVASFDRNAWYLDFKLDSSSYPAAIMLLQRLCSYTKTSSVLSGYKPDRLAGILSATTSTLLKTLSATDSRYDTYSHVLKSKT